jgi:rubrerythrin
LTRSGLSIIILYTRVFSLSSNTIGGKAGEMATEQDRTLQVLKLAIDMETDGQKFYLQASQRSGNKMGKELLKSLAAEEERHRQTFIGIYEAIRNKKAWPRIDLPPERDKKLRTIFARASVADSATVKPDSSELDAVQTAIEMEVKSYNLYAGESKSARHDTEREFYDKLAGEERQHHLILLDYSEYLKDPAQWFTGKEHHSLDGG